MPTGASTTFDFIVSKSDGDNSLQLVTSLNVSIVNGLEFIIHSTFAIRYPYPYSDASEKRCKPYSLILPNFLGLKHLSTLMPSKSSRLDFHAAHCLAILSGIRSSQSKFWWHKLWIILQPSSMNGAASASGSYIKFNNGNIPCLVKGLFFMCT